jgi:hypothetical protein
MTPQTSSPGEFLARLDALQAELADLAFALERRRRLDAAEVTNAIAGRVGEIRRELAAADEAAGRGPGEPLRRSR